MTFPLIDYNLRIYLRSYMRAVDVCLVDVRPLVLYEARRFSLHCSECRVEILVSCLLNKCSGLFHPLCWSRET